MNWLRINYQVSGNRKPIVDQLRIKGVWLDVATGEKIRNLIRKKYPEGLLVGFAPHKIDRVIFLDIDGVLNDRAFFVRRNKRKANKPIKPVRTEAEFFSDNLNPEKVKLLAQIIKATEARVVISSTWRKTHRIDVITHALENLGLQKDVVIGRTEVFHTNASVRGNEIRAWLLKNRGYSFKSYVILDDDSDMLYWQRDNFVQTKNEDGLTEKDVRKAIRILTRGVKCKN